MEPQFKTSANDSRVDDKEKLNGLTRPLSSRGMPAWFIYLTGLVGLIYMLNPTAGIIEFIPDNIPFIGNLDEGVAFLLVWYSLVEFFEGRKK